MDAGEVDMKERILMTRTEYFVLKEVLKDDECGWSKTIHSSHTHRHLQIHHMREEREKNPTPKEQRPQQSTPTPSSILPLAHGTEPGQPHRHAPAPLAGPTPAA
jgi:hypothetical protein